MVKRVLIVEDDIILNRTISKALAPYARVSSSINLADAQNKLSCMKFDLCIFDLNLSNDITALEGITLTALASKFNIKSIVLTSLNDEDIKVQAYEAGCFAYYLKTKFFNEIDIYLTEIFQEKAIQIDWNDFFQSQFTTQNKKLQDEIINTFTVATTKQNILLTGPTGTGKTTLAKLIHQFTIGPDRPFVHINLSELSENIIESELFGTKEGAFTGAKNREGLFEKARGGTIFLDEIDSIPLSLQVKIQVALEEKVFRKMGDNESYSIEFNIITATCSDLKTRISKGEFREDFYFRINGYELFIPGLAKRREDIKPIVKMLCEQAKQEIVFDEHAWQYLLRLPLRGNIRQLKNLVQFFIATQKYYIRLNDLKQSPVLFNELKKLNGDSRDTINLEDILNDGLPQYIESIEEEVMVKALTKFKNLTKAANALKIGNRKAKRIFDSLKNKEQEGIGVNNEC